MKTYNQKIEAVKSKYEARIILVLDTIKVALSKAGLEISDTYFDNSGDYRWYFDVRVKRASHENSVDVTVKIDESITYDGSKEGVNFSLDIVADGGAIVGQFAPFNYTYQVWVRFASVKKMEERFKMLEQLDLPGIVKTISDFFNP